MSASGEKTKTLDSSENVSSKETQQAVPSSICLLASCIILGVCKTFTSDQVPNIRVVSGHWKAKPLQLVPVLRVLASVVSVGSQECYK